MPGMIFRRTFRLTFVVLLLVILLNASDFAIFDPSQRVREFTRALEFDYVNWTLQALVTKLSQGALSASRYLPEAAQKQVVLDYLDLVRQMQSAEASLNQIYSDPNVVDKESTSLELRQQIQRFHRRSDLLEPLAEEILENQVSQIAAELGLALGGQILPPVLYHTTQPPDALIVSPRDTIRQEANISLTPELSVDQFQELEEKVDAALDVSSLVVGIGGVGLYPTMVMRTTDPNWLAEVVAHEWIHNYLTLRPLGITYANNPELRTMNETVAAIAGKEIGRAVIERFYPQFLPPPPSEATPTPESAPESEAESEPPSPPPFDFLKEMRETRVNVDRLLADGKIEQAETYMELRRRFLWDNGYQIRKLNQAYFAFHGAYADQPGGAAGDDPVGEAVRALRVQSTSLADFLDRIAWMWSFDQLKSAVGQE